MEERKNILQNNVGIIPSRSENEIRCGLFLYVYNCLQKAKGSSRAKRAESRMHLLDPEPDLGNANVGR